jgi:hypothetical protein
MKWQIIDKHTYKTWELLSDTLLLISRDVEPLILTEKGGRNIAVLETTPALESIPLHLTWAVRLYMLPNH